MHWNCNDSIRRLELKIRFCFCKGVLSPTPLGDLCLSRVYFQHRRTMRAKERRRRILEEAWIGDAVLCLYCRDRILKRDGTVDVAINSTA